jgi:hypothetical protein
MRISRTTLAANSRLALLSLVFGAATSLCSASPITYTMTATASGTLAGTAFTNAAITVTSVADTSQVFTTPPFPPPDTVYDVFPASSSISIAGFAPATFTDQTFWEDPNGSGDIIFGIAGVEGPGFAFCSPCDGILGFVNFFTSPSLASYDLESSFGPVSLGTGAFDFEIEAFNAFQNIPTSEGSLSLNVASNDTFTAVAATPEPASFLLAGLGLLGVLVTVVGAGAGVA